MGVPSTVPQMDAQLFSGRRAQTDTTQLLIIVDCEKNVFYGLLESNTSGIPMSWREHWQRSLRNRAHPGLSKAQHLDVGPKANGILKVLGGSPKNIPLKLKFLGY